MKLVVKNLGNIAEAEIDLHRDFYVFVGYNNTGKTYLSQVLWAVLDKKTIREFALQSSIKVLQTDSTVTISENILAEILTEYANFLSKNVGNFLVNNAKDNTIFSKTIIELHYNNVFFTDIIANIQNVLPEVSIVIENLNLQFSSKLSDTKTISIDYKGEQHLKNVSLLAVILDFLVNDEQHNLFFLPANRTFFLSFNQYIYQFEAEKSKKYQELPKILQGLKGQEHENTLNNFLAAYKQPYTEATNELIKSIYLLNQQNKETNEINYFADELTKIIGGAITTRKFEGIAPNEFYLKPENSEINLPLYLSSSSANQLSTLYLYFKYWATNDKNFLIIDEPEQNLHPKNQVALLELLIKFSKKNNKVLITTHSTFLADVINNYLLLGSLENKEEMMQSLGMTTFLEKSRTGIYFFNGEKVYEYEIGDYGTIFKDFRAEENKLAENAYNLTEKIYEQQKRKEKSEKEKSEKETPKPENS